MYLSPTGASRTLREGRGTPGMLTPAARRPSGLSRKRASSVNSPAPEGQTRVQVLCRFRPAREESLPYFDVSEEKVSW